MFVVSYTLTVTPFPRLFTPPPFLLAYSTLLSMVFNGGKIYLS